MAGSTLEQLKALSAERRRPAREREERMLAERYAGQYVAYTDDWDDRYQLVRTVLAATPDRAEFDRLWDANGWASQHWVKAVAVPPAAPLPAHPPAQDHAVVREALRLINAKTPAQREALRRVDAALCERYPGHDVAFLDVWNGDQLVRLVVAASTDVADFHERLRWLSADIRSRVQMTRMSDPDVIDCPSVWFE